MSKLTAVNPTELALVSSPTGGSAVFTVESTNSSSKVEIWERFLPFAALPAPPPFKKTGTFSALATVPRDVPMGGVHQVRMFRENQGTSSGVHESIGNVIGQLDFPCVRRAPRVNFLTRCASMPLIDITRGGTFISMAFAGNSPARSRVQLGAKPPAVDGAGFPFFAPADLVSSVVSDGPKLLQKASLIGDFSFDTDATPRSAMRTDQKLFFVIFCWNALGEWDFVWNTTGLAPTTAPEVITTKARAVEVRLAKLRCLDDSDDFSKGEADFTFEVTDGTPVRKTKTVSWTGMDTGDDLVIQKTATNVTVNPPDAAGGVSIRIDAVEDDSGSFPPDDDDKASVGGLSGSVALPFPVGEVKEEVNDALLTFYSAQRTFSERLSFVAEVVYSVRYV